MSNTNKSVANKYTPSLEHVCFRLRLHIKIICTGLCLLMVTPLLAQESYAPPTTPKANTAKNVIVVDLRAGTSLQGEVIELTESSLTLETKHGEVVLKIRDIEQKCWEKILEEVPRTAVRKDSAQGPKQKRFVSEMINKTNDTEEIPDLEKISLSEINYQFRKYFKSVNNSAEFIYSPEGQPDPSIAKDNLTIWILDNSDGKTSKELTDQFLERFKPDSKNFEIDQHNDATIFYGDRSMDKDNNFKYVMGKTALNGTTGWILLYTHTNSEGELKGWKTDKLQKYKEVLKDFDSWPIELLDISSQ